MEVVFLFIGLAVGFAMAFLYLKSRGESLLSATTEKARIFEQERDTLKREKEEKQTEIIHLTNELGVQKNEITNLNHRLLEKEKDLEQLNERLRNDFKVLANQILEEKSQKFTEQNKSNLDIILNPFKEKLEKFEQKVEQTYKSESAERIVLKTEIKNLIELNKQISEEANNLATALKGDNKQQGNWGEVVLEKILERSGLKEGQEYQTQFTDTNINGERIKPDVVVFLPDEKHVIIDSKVSLVAYESCVNANNEDDRSKFMKLHIESLRSHIKTLSDKNYTTASRLQSPDFVLLFVPIESSFSLAVQGDLELFNFAWDRKIVIVSPTTLLATLRTIASLWKQERQTRNALEIAEEGGKLYDKFVAFYEDLEKVGKKMDDAKKDYVEAMRKLYEGTGNLVRRAEKMKELGAKTTRQLPKNIIERATE